MVGMFVGDENAGQGLGSSRKAGEFLADLPAAEPGVDQEPDFAGFEIGAIAAGAAAKDGEVN